MAEIAAQQHGIVTRTQLLGCGISSTSIERLLIAGFLIPVFPGVYRLGHAAPSTDADYMGASLACGKAPIAKLPAAYLQGLTKLSARPRRSS